MIATNLRACGVLLGFCLLSAGCGEPSASLRASVVDPPLAAGGVGGARPEPPRVLVIDDEPNWSWRYLTQSLAREAGLPVSACLVATESAPNCVPLPTSAAALAAYDVVICGDFVVPGDDASVSKWYGALAAFVRAGGGVIFVCGAESPSRWQRAEIAAMLPVQLEPAARAAEASNLELADDAPIDFAAAEAGVAPVASLAALEPIACMPVAGLAPSARAIAVDGKRKQPVLASIEVGEGKALWVGSDETWRWRGADRDMMAGVWVRLVRFAATGRR